MAARTKINTRFIFIVLTVLLTAGGLIGGVIYVQKRGDASRQMRLGDELMEQGHIEGAVQHYGRAVRRDPGNLQYLRTLENTLRQIRPETGDASRTYYGRLLTALRQEAMYNPSDPESHLRLLRELHGSARMMALLAPPAARRSQWEQLSSAASDMLTRVASSDPKYVYGNLYRGIATTGLRATIGETDLDRADRDLVAFVEAFPDSDLGWASLAHSRFRVAEHMRTAGSPRRASETAARVQPTMMQAIEAVPDGPRTNLIYAQYRIWQFRNREEGVTEEQVMQAARRAISLLRDTDDTWLVLEASTVATALIGRQEADAALDLFANVIERDPSALLHRYFLAQLYFQLGESDLAMELAEQVIIAEPLRVSFASQMQLTLRRLAAGLQVDIEHRNYAEAEAAGRDRDMARVEASRARLATFVIDPENDPQLIRADAKLALLKRDHEAAAAGFEKLIRDGGGDFEELVFSAFALEQIGQIGLAHVRTTAALDQREVPFLMLRKARLEYAMGRFDDAAQTIAAYLNVVPDDAQAASFARAIEDSRAGEGVASDPVQLALRDAQRAMEEGQSETALATVEAAMSSLGYEDLRLLNAAARISMSSGQTDAAMGYVERALALQSDSRHFRQLQTMLQTGDPVSAAEQFMEAEFEDEAERAVMLLITYASIAEEHRRNASALEVDGRHERAAAAREIATRAEAAANRQLTVAERLAANHPQLIEYRFARALAARNWTEAEILANRARDANADRARGLIYRGRFEFYRERYDQAVRAFQQATELVPYSTTPWRGLGLSYQRIGNQREALRAFEQAYRANPNDMNTVRSYLGLLIQMGETARATRIAQTAYRLMPNDVQMREGWLELESQSGNPRAVLPIRREIYAENPDDRENAVRLAILLARTEPTVESLMEADGTRTYSERRWNQLSPLEQQRRLAAKRTEWRDEADRIVADIEARGGEDLALASVKALLFRMRGDVTAGERVLRRYIEAMPQSELDATTFLTLGQYLAEAGQFSEAYAEFVRAARYQNDEVREADRVMGHFLFERGAFDGAIQHFERVLEVTSDYNIELRIVDAYVNQGKFEHADQRLRRALTEHPIDFMGTMLQAIVAHGVGTQMANAGRNADAQAKFADYRQAIEAAERLMPTNPAPHAMRARMLLADFHRTGQRTLLNDAMTALGRADSVRPNDPQTSLVRIEVLRVMNNTAAAVAEASRLVDSSPDNIAYRRLLVQIHTQSRNFPAAVAVIRQAIERWPTMVVWHEMLGNVQAEAGNLREATAAFQRAFELGDSVPNLIRYVGTLLALENPDYNGVLNMLRTVPEHVNNHPVLSSSFAVALHKTGRPDQARQYIQRSYNRQRELISAGQANSEISRWFQVLNAVFASMTPQQVEQLVMELTGENPDAYELLWMGRYWSTLGDQGLSRSTELLGKAIDKTGQGEEQLRLLLQFEIATYYLMADRYEAAATGYERALRIDPDHVPTLNNLAFVKTQHLNQAAEALPLAQRALAQSPQDASILDTVGWVHFKLGNHTQAEEFLRRSLAVNESAMTQLHLAHVFAAIGEYDGALTRLRRAGELRPDSRTQGEIDRLADDIRTKRTQAR